MVVLAAPLITFATAYVVGSANGAADEVANSKKAANNTQAASFKELPPGILKGLEKDSGGICNNAFKITVPEHSRSRDFRDACTHGPDTAETLGVTATAAQTSSSGAVVPCFGDGVSGRRVQTLYVVTSDKTDRYEQFKSSFQSWAADVDNLIDQSGRKTGSELHAKWLTDNCQLDVQKVVVQPGANDSIGSTIAAVRDAGYTDPNRKYLMWTDADVYCGIAEISLDDRQDPVVNRNNSGPNYARVDTPCWGRGGAVELHELFHNLGAVQLSAPNTSGGFHCVDEWDRLCYQDSAGVVLKYECPSDQANLLDCNDNDYLHSNPAPESYLATHWNTFDSGFLYSEELEDTNAPSAPVLSATQQPGNVMLDWNDVVDPEGSDVTYRLLRGAYNDTRDLYASTNTSNYDDRYTEPETFYQYSVVAVDEFGNTSPESNIISITTLPVTDPGDTTPPPVVENLSTSNVTAYGFTLNWGLPADTSDIDALHIELLNNGTYIVGPDTVSRDYCCTLTPETSYGMRVKSIDKAGNTAYSATIYQTTAEVPPAPTGSVVPYNLQVVTENGSEIILSADIDSTTDGSDNFYYRLVHVGLSTTVNHFFASTTTPKTYTFTSPNILPQSVSGFYISVRDYDTDVEVHRSETLNYSYSGSSESNAPSTPSSIGVTFTNATTAKVSWTASTDDSGKIYRYYQTLTSAAGYNNSRNGYLLSSNFYGLTSGDSYTFTIEAEDIWGNRSTQANHTFTMP